MTMRVTSAIIVSALIVVGLVFATASTVARDRAKHAEMLWLAYEDDNSKQAQALEAMVTHLGFGGMIHHFKNYVLRGDAPRVERIEALIEAALSAIDRYGAFSISEDEAAALAKVKSAASAAEELDASIAETGTQVTQSSAIAKQASSEAGRTGEAGKGFAVVATEVKNLAGQTTKATDEISSQINTLQIASESVEHNIGGVTDTILNLSELSNAVASAVEEQSTATGSISQNVQHAAAGSNEVAHGIETVSAVASETKEAAGKLQQSADTLSRQAGELNQQVFDFLNQVRAA